MPALIFGFAFRCGTRHFPFGFTVLAVCRREEQMNGLPDRLLAAPTEKILGSDVPFLNDPVDILKNNGEIRHLLHQLPEPSLAHLSIFVGRVHSYLPTYRTRSSSTVRLQTFDQKRSIVKGGQFLTSVCETLTTSNTRRWKFFLR